MKTKLPNFGYQIQLASGEVEKHIQTKDQIKQLLNALYGGKGPNGERGFDVKKGIAFEDLPKLQRSRLLDDSMLDYYADQYSKNGMHGTRKSSTPSPIPPTRVPLAQQ